jgi:hypothetical protein
MAKSKKVVRKDVDEDVPPTKSLLDDIKDKRKIEYESRSNKRVKRDIDSQLEKAYFSDSESDNEREDVRHMKYLITCPD